MEEPKRWYISSVAGSTISGAKGSELIAAVGAMVPSSTMRPPTPTQPPRRGQRHRADANLCTHRTVILTTLVSRNNGCTVDGTFHVSKYRDPRRSAGFPV